MSGGRFFKKRQHMMMRSGYATDRATTAAMLAAKSEAMDALAALEKNPADPALRRKAIEKHEHLASLYRRLTGRDLFDHALPLVGGAA